MRSSTIIKPKHRKGFRPTDSPRTGKTYYSALVAIQIMGAIRHLPGANIPFASLVPVILICAGMLTPESIWKLPMF